MDQRQRYYYFYSRFTVTIPFPLTVTIAVIILGPILEASRPHVAQPQHTAADSEAPTPETRAEAKNKLCFLGV